MKNETKPNKKSFEDMLKDEIINGIRQREAQRRHIKHTQEELRVIKRIVFAVNNIDRLQKENDLLKKQIEKLDSLLESNKYYMESLDRKDTLKLLKQAEK